MEVDRLKAQSAEHLRRLREFHEETYRLVKQEMEGKNCDQLRGEVLGSLERRLPEDLLTLEYKLMRKDRSIMRLISDGSFEYHYNLKNEAFEELLEGNREVRQKSLDYVRQRLNL